MVAGSRLVRSFRSSGQLLTRLFQYSVGTFQINVPSILAECRILKDSLKSANKICEILPELLVQGYYLDRVIFCKCTVNQNNEMVQSIQEWAK